MSANVKKRLRLEYLGKDKPNEPGVEAAGADALDIISEGSHLYGSVLIPDGSYEALRPCVILIHGFPGTARNDDLAQALRRIGCVVLTPHHRGAWGSEGKYLISNCVEDMVHIAEWVRSPEICEKWKIDPDSIFLCGHSMGGNTALQSGRRLRG
ncbi:alpha/beta fold hydrolase [Clostridiaceae bacterium OF09-1]|nr:alpha/beta fold hydrolase [Clostridiaceae bacterium OF09-1]